MIDDDDDDDDHSPVSELDVSFPDVDDEFEEILEGGLHVSAQAL